MQDDLEIIEAHLDGLLDKAQAKALEARLAGDADLRAALEASRGLRQALHSAKPDVPSERMWKGIQARLAAQGNLQEPSRASGLDWLTRPWPWTLRAGLAAGLAAVAVVVIKPWDAKPPVPETGFAPAPEKMSGSAPKASERSRAPAKVPVQAQPASRPAEVASKQALEAPAFKGKTEVERALESSDLDHMIQAMLREEARLQALAPAPAAVAARAPRRTMRSASAASGLGEVARFAPQPEAAAPSLADEVRPVQALGRLDEQGFWDWRPAALAMNGRDWAQAQAELESARGRAPEAAERAFAASALALLSASGALAAPSFTAQPGPLLVQSAGRWQLLVESRQARYSQGVAARLPGWRTEGESLVLDLGLDRAAFSAGTRFTRLAGDKSARFLDAQGAELARDEVLAPRGASYSVGQEELRLR